MINAAENIGSDDLTMGRTGGGAKQNGRAKQKGRKTSRAKTQGPRLSEASGPQVHIAFSSILGQDLWPHFLEL